MSNLANLFRGPSYKNISGNDLKKIMMKYNNILIIDVRDSEEYREGHIPNAINIPVDVINNNISTIASYEADKIIVYCKTGMRSTRACQILSQNGLSVYNLSGGMSAYKRGL